ncbi:MAG: GNAT family N-acetyltransferase [Myxococcota bacterium]|nr:GNAT family N-acetyltransferase [Myxococcota bacterium]
MTTSLPWRFRHATLEDVPAIVALVNECYRGDSSRGGWTTEAELLEGGIRTDADEIRACIERDRSVVLLAEDGGALVACAHVAATAADDAATFGMFAVEPARQRGGGGKAVLAEAERIARDRWQLAVMRLQVIDVRTELLAFYERRGYVRTGIKEPFPSDQHQFGVPRRADLRFELLEKRLAPFSAP